MGSFSFVAGQKFQIGGLAVDDQAKHSRSYSVWLPLLELAKCEAHRFQPRTLDELEEQILYTFISFALKF